MTEDVVDSRVGHEASDGGVRTSSIVEADESAEGMETVAVRPIGSSVGPLVEQGLDEALGLAVGLGSERAGSLVPNLVAAEDVAVGVTAIAGSVEFPIVVKSPR